MATLAALRKLALSKLGVYEHGQSIDSEADADLSAAYQEYYDELLHLGLVSWSSTDDVPGRFVQPIADRIAYMRALNYSVSAERLQVLSADSSTAEQRIRRAAAQEIVPITVEVEDF